MAKKGRNKKFQVKESPKERRGFTVVDAQGKRVYLSSSSEGLSERDAQTLSDGLVISSRVVAIDQLV